MSLSNLLRWTRLLQNCSGIYFIAEAVEDETDGAKDCAQPNRGRNKTLWKVGRMEGWKARFDED